MRVMRIVIHDYGGYPFTAQLARSLAGRGHEVLYLNRIVQHRPDVVLSVPSSLDAQAAAQRAAHANEAAFVASLKGPSEAAGRDARVAPP